MKMRAKKKINDGENEKERKKASKNHELKEENIVNSLLTCRKCASEFL